MLNRQGVYGLFAITSVGLAAGLWIFGSWQSVEADTNRLSAQITVMPTRSSAQRVKPPRQKVKAIYLTAYSAGNPKKIDEIIHLIESTELNAVVIDIKDYSGLVLYGSKLLLVQQLHLSDNRLHDVTALINKLHQHHIYVIARQTVFQDPSLARAKPEWAIRDKRGGLWHDKKGLTWVDATRPEVWKYNMAIAKEVAGLGFDEINFDYIRFPSDGNMSEVVYTNGDLAKKYLTMRSFYQFVSKELADQPVWTSFDMFGFVMEKKGEDDMNIGQRLTDAVDDADYVCPMMYPSHYPPGHLGLKNPADFPGQVLEHGLSLGTPVFVGKRAELRPWIQAFNLGAVYDGTKIRTEIDEVEKYTPAGWMMWNASNRYTAAGLKPKSYGLVQR